MRNDTSVCLLGAAGDTSNLGVDALLEATLVGVHRTLPDAAITVFDNGLGVRSGSVTGPDGVLEFDRIGIRSSRRVQRPESMTNMKWAIRFPFIPNEGVDRLRRCDVVLDISGGDSFSDIYGVERFRAIADQKAIALAAGKPLVLLPQTYGPYEFDSSRVRAATLIRRASVVWARDEPSFEVLQSLIGSDYDAQRHRVGVDVAFALPRRTPKHIEPDIAAWLDGDTGVFGVNVSGLLANDKSSHVKFGLADEHDGLMFGLMTNILQRTDANLLLIPHVRSDLWVVESDIAACRRLAEHLRLEFPDRVRVLEGVDDAQEVKWVIGRCDAFCGTRMHSVIAALSSEIPAMALAYSPKTAGVVQSCAQGRRVSDLRCDSAQEIADGAVDLWYSRSAVRSQLAEAMPCVIARAQEPFRSLSSMVGRLSDRTVGSAGEAGP